MSVIQDFSARGDKYTSVRKAVNKGNVNKNSKECSHAKR